MEYSMTLHRDPKLFQEAIRFTAQRMNLKPEFIEKDYWVTSLLFAIFSSEPGKDCVFKGGTALSKCFSIIDRFSEDIDLVIIRREGETDNRLKAKLKAISLVAEEVLPELVVEGLTQKRGMNRKTAHTYSKTFMGNYGQIRDVVVLESSWYGSPEPYSQKTINSFIGDMMIAGQQTDLASRYQLLPFTVKALNPERTICEKIMSLVRFSYTDNPIGELRTKIRHLYDLHQLMKQPAYSDFLRSDSFEGMLIKVRNDDIASFRNNNNWLKEHPCEALIFKNPESVWSELISTYHGPFRELVYGPFPDQAAVLKTLLMIKERLNRVNWAVLSGN